MTDNLERLRARDEHTAQWAVGEIESNRAAIAELVGALVACLPSLPPVAYYGARAIITKYNHIVKE